MSSVLRICCQISSINSAKTKQRPDGGLPAVPRYEYVQVSNEQEYVRMLSEGWEPRTQAFGKVTMRKLSRNFP
jgi:hypothetical protein